MIRANQDPDAVKRDKCIRCGLIFGAQYTCPHCQKELERAYLAEPMRHLKDGYICQFCAKDIDGKDPSEINKERPGWAKYNHSGIGLEEA